MQPDFETRPIPSPGSGEERQKFISRCMGDSVMNREYPDQKVRAGVCYTAWRRKKGERAMTSTNGLETRVWLPESELRIIEAEGQPTKIMGLAAPYGRLSDDLGGFRERILPGAFTAALASGEDMRADVEHDRRMLLGRTSKGTLTFSEFSDSGLWATVTIPNTSRGRDVLEDVRNGNLDGMSVSWLRKGTEDRFTEADGETIREVLKAQLRGVALTATPAYRQTVDTLTIRSLEAFEAERIGAQVVASIERNRRRLIELEAARYPAG